MKTLYLDLFSGISGDMFLGALLDLGVEFDLLERELRKLDLAGYHLHAARRQKNGIEGVKLDVHLEEAHVHPAPATPPAHPHEHDHPHPHDHDHGHAHDHDHGHAHPHDHSHPHAQEPQAHAHHSGHQHGRNFAEIKQLIAASPYSDWVKQKATAIFYRVAVAEGKVHGRLPDQVHFHEVGAVDSIVDIVGACLGLEMLGKPRVLASEITEGTGWIECAHGRFPIPAPATLEILSARRAPLRQCDETSELVTPTGAALLAELAESFGPLSGLAPERIGYGLGTRDHPSRPNVLRAILCEPQSTTHDWETDRVAVLQTNLDDLSGEILGQVLQRALDEGALDVFHTAVQMKKNRPGVLLTLLCAEAETEKFAAFLLRETSAFGVRFHTAERRKLQREFARVETPLGPIAVKFGKLDGEVLQAAPEYESCRQVAEATGQPLRRVYEAALRALQYPAV